MQIIKAASDRTAYRYLELENQLAVLIASEPSAQKSSLALSVGVGSGSDPVERQGLAHFVEHMLFRGTEEYPVQSSYDEFINANSGSSNAFTSFSETNYYFKVANEAFPEAATRFSSFFRKPLFLEDMVGRQLKAVHAEHAKNLKNDPHRLYQLQKHLASPESPYHKFSTGNLRTLEHPNIHKEMLQSYYGHYSANIMKLVAISPLPLDEAETLLRRLFSTVENRKYSPLKSKVVAYPPERLSKFVRYVSVKEGNKLGLQFLLPSMQHLYRSHPLRYFSALVGHEGPGSLLSALVEEGLGLELSCGCYDNESAGFSQLSMEVKLTERGLAEYQRVLRIVLSYFKMLRKEGVQQWFFQELRSVKRLKFENLETEHPDSFTKSKASGLQLYPPQEVLVAGYLLEDFSQQLLQNTLDQLRLKNCIVVLQSQEHLQLCDQVEPVYQSPFSLAPIPQSFLQFESSPLLQPTAKALKLPPPNLFVPKLTHLKELQKKHQPELVYSSERSACYYKPDLEEEVAKASLFISFVSNSEPAGPREVLLRKLAEQLLKNYLRQHLYLGETAQFNTKHHLRKNRLDLQFTGFDQTLHAFALSTITLVLRFFEEGSYLTNFDDIKANLLSSYRNLRKETPFFENYKRVQRLLVSGDEFQPEECLPQFDGITAGMVAAFIKASLQRVKLIVLALGNITKAQSIEFVRQVEDLLRTKPALRTQDTSEVRPVRLERATRLVLEADEVHTNSCLTVVKQLGLKTPRTKVLGLLVENLMGEKFKTAIRVERGVGYLVWFYLVEIKTALYVLSSAQSEWSYPNQTLSFFNDFEAGMRAAVQRVDPAGFALMKESVAGQLREKDHKLSKKAAELFVEILTARGQILFGRREAELKQLSQVTLEEFKKFAINYLESEAKLELQTVSKVHAGPNGEGLERQSLEAFRRGCSLYPALPY